MLAYYGDNYVRALLTLFPDIGLDKSKFPRRTGTPLTSPLPRPFLSPLPHLPSYFYFAIFICDYLCYVDDPRDSFIGFIKANNFDPPPSPLLPSSSFPYFAVFICNYLFLFVIICFYL